MSSNLVIHSSIVKSLGQSVTGLNNAKHVFYAAKYVYVKGKIITLIAAQALETLSDLFRATLKFKLYITSRALFCLYGPSNDDERGKEAFKEWEDKRSQRIVADLSKDFQVIGMLMRSLISPTSYLDESSVDTVVANIKVDEDKNLLLSGTNHLMERMALISVHNGKIGFVSNVWFRVVALLSLLTKSVDVVSLLLTTTVIVVEESVANSPSALATGNTAYFNVMRTRVHNQWLKIKNEMVDAYYHAGLIIKPMSNDDMAKYIRGYINDMETSDIYSDFERVNLDVYDSSN